MTDFSIPAHYKPQQQPLASHDAMVYAGNVRITLLTDRLFRLEYHPQGCFEDRASQAFWFRAQPVPEYSIELQAGVLEIQTAHLHLRYEPEHGTGFTPYNLSIRLKPDGHIWRPGDVPTGNLLGTTRTLDAVNGYAPLEPGLLSRDGWSVVNDSATLVFNDTGWIEPRTPGGIDWYFFGYGHDYKACLADYCQISGRMPMIPRWILGNWWSRYWAYTQDELQTLIGDFQANQIPLSVCIVDMDWHLTQTGNASSGWTGYTWNPALIPNPEGLIAFFHRNGLRTALNLHPADGVHDHEAGYPEMARRMGIDPATRQPIRFNITDPRFAQAYFEVLHHPLETVGVDFWWVDWQQGQDCDLPGLDPLWLINHLHFHDLGRDGKRRPFIFSRWGREGHQRYPIGFSGDSYRTWDSLRFQPYMTATATNIGYGWWSHDIGGHIGGANDPELFVRWVQFGAFSPILRLHTGKGAYYDQRPWQFEDASVVRALREAMQLRHALIPYLYSMAWRAHSESLPLLQPLYYEFPEHEEAYHCPQQYLFGTELIAAPFVTPADPDTGLSRQVVWLPPGDWYHFFSGQHYRGDGWHAIYGRLGDIPVFARAGAIVPMGPPTGWGGVDIPPELHLHVFAGADNTFTLYEDDGDSQAYLNGRHTLTRITLRGAPAALEITVNTPDGQIPAGRVICLTIHGVSTAGQVSAVLNGAALPVQSTPDPDNECLRLSGIPTRPGSTLRVEVKAPAENHALLARRDRRRETILYLLKWFKINNGIRNQIAAEIVSIVQEPARLAPYLITMAEAQGRALFEVLCQAGIHSVPDTQWPVLVVVWNNTASDAITYRFGHAYQHFGGVWAQHENGPAPRFAAIKPPVKTWRHGKLDQHLHMTQWRAQMDYMNLLTVVESGAKTSG